MTQQAETANGAGASATTLRLGPLTIPTEQVVFVAGLAAVTALGLLDPPLALVVAAGHLLAATSARHRLLAAIGQALEEA